MRRYFFIWCVIGGCGLGLPQGGGAEGEASGSSGTASGGVTTGAAGSSSTMMDGPTSGVGPGGGSTGVMMPGTEGPAGSSTTVDEGMTFIRHDSAEEAACDVFAQDCARGEKCAAYANGGMYLNDSKCVPVMEDPAQPGESCFAEGGGLSGIDDCAFGAMCWDVDALGMGTCVLLCTGFPEDPVCPDGFTCGLLVSESVLNLCLAKCDPLAKDTCADNEVCIPTVNGYAFMCAVDKSGDEGQANDPCEYASACDPELYCIPLMYAAECDQQVSGCCQPYCDVMLPNTCEGAGQSCVALFEEGAVSPEYEDVGVCAVPS